MNLGCAIKRVLIRELNQIYRRKSRVMLMFVLPIFSMLFFSVFFQNGVALNIPIAVCDLDNTSLSRSLCGMIDDTPTVLVAYDVASVEQGENLIRRGVVGAIVIVPKGFERDVYAGESTTIRANISGLNISANGMLSSAIKRATTSFSVGFQREVLQENGLSAQDAKFISMPIMIDNHVLFNPYLNYGYYLLPSFMSMMLMIFAVILTIYCIGLELRYSTVSKWLDSAGGSFSAALIGKLLPYTIAMIMVSLFMNVAIYKFSGVPLNGSLWVLILAAILLVVVYQAIAVAMIAIFANLRLSLSIAGGYTILAFTFSGLTFPLMAMEPWLATLSYIFPFTFYTEIFIDQAMRGAPVIGSLRDMGYMLFFVAISLLLLPRLRTIMLNSRYWGRL